ncbi:hypothetical protein C2845_PM08G14490 [Panicum miliaceum]|uniref:Uncharacterized protein n=1 Tax=Panicum miliaceum TaxID=4540 RepID=A0A3L6QYN1_PANMI|nr:hypothetical protein C2845_PM08G14490 [Panicum miliaceum]
MLRLHEVLATRSKVYLVMELALAGTPGSPPCPRRLPGHAARCVFLQLVSAVIYSCEYVVPRWVSQPARQGMGRISGVTATPREGAATRASSAAGA